MIAKHVTQKGEVIPIILLNNDHLEGIINLLVNKLEECKKALAVKENEFLVLIYEPTGINKIQAKVFVQNFYTIVAPYLLEATLRDLNNLDVLVARMNRISDREAFIKNAKFEKNTLEYLTTDIPFLTDANIDNESANALQEP